MFLSLPLHIQDARKGGGGDVQPGGNGDVVFHGFVDCIPAYHKDMGPPEQVAAHVDPAFMLLRDGVVQDQGKIEDGAKRGKPASYTARQ